MPEPLALTLVSRCDDLGLVVSTAESCTGGLIAAAITDVPGSSSVFERGFVTYGNGAKIDMLGVEADALEAHGAVSAEVARQMALGAIKHSHANLAVSVTGIAGPSGGSEAKPVGLVFSAVAARGDGEAIVVATKKFEFSPELGRTGIREATMRGALQLLIDASALERP